jgi:hypothetical protein
VQVAQSGANDGYRPLIGENTWGSICNSRYRGLWRKEVFGELSRTLKSQSKSQPLVVKEVWIVDMVRVCSRDRSLTDSESGVSRTPGARSSEAPFELAPGNNPRSYEGRGLTWKSSACCSNPSKGPRKSPRVWKNLHFSERGT